MCELLGVASSVPTDIAFSFSGFALRGGHTGPHADGWGVSLYERHFAHTFLEPRPAWNSSLARFLRENPIRTTLAVAHIRKMTRVLHNRHIVFAHNGTLPNVRARALHIESPIGETDSEHAFCVVLEALRAAYPSGYPANAEELGRTLFELGNELGSDGVFNFLFADGRHLFARCGDNLSSIIRRAPFGEATLVDADVKVNFADGMGESLDDSMAVVATEPLTKDETWQKAAPGTLWVFGEGDLLAEYLPRDSRPAAVAKEAYEAFKASSS
jgi:predicted glutamine amidotransferase